MSQHELVLDTGQGSGAVSEGRRRRSRLGLVVTGVVGGSLVALYAVAAPFVAPALRRVCLPFVPATTAQVENVLRVLRTRTGTLVDIGSGDGRIVSADWPYHLSVSIHIYKIGYLFIYFCLKQSPCNFP
uniref:FATP synthase c subunit lysine N-methyltransferase n=1 Tax=Xiphophorus couchianus TaxID=32473 RepID=A0A3B5LDL9_9TELE